jgi:hypothetical protein
VKSNDQRALTATASASTVRFGSIASAGSAAFTSGLPPSTDIARPAPLVRFVPTPEVAPSLDHRDFNPCTSQRVSRRSAIAIDVRGPFVQQFLDSSVDKLPIFQMTEIV